MKIRGSTQKFLLKELMRDKLPPAILTRRKEGFDIPAHDWFRGRAAPAAAGYAVAGSRPRAPAFSAADAVEQR